MLVKVVYEPTTKVSGAKSETIYDYYLSVWRRTNLWAQAAISAGVKLASKIRWRLKSRKLQR